MASKLSALIAATTEKTTPVDTDKLPILDSAATNYFKWIGWGSLKTALSAIFPLLAGKTGGQTLIGGTGVTDKLVLQGTSGNGTGTATAIEFKVGNNGGASAFRLKNNGSIEIAGTSPDNATGILSISNNYIGTYIPCFGFYAPNIAGGQSTYCYMGKSATTNNRVTVASYIHTGDGSSSNYFGIGGFYNNNNEVRIYPSGAVSMTNGAPLAHLHVVKTTEQLRLGYDASNFASFTVASDGTLNLTTSNNKITYGTSRTPASASATGTAGELCWDSSYIYVCTAANTWKRAALTTW